VLGFLLSIHSTIVPLVLIAGGLGLLCGLALIYQTRRSAGTAAAGSVAMLRRVFRGLLAVTAGLGVLQAIFGVLLVTQGCQPREGLHYVYGLIVLGAIPVAYVYSDQKQVRRDIIILTIAVVAIIGAAIRALSTGPGGICH
jgi:hypothetical protein